ncbi:MAG: 3-dehydroquinate synthase [Myxococcota bacterium]|jgi:3-dehydroquinate synthase
MTPPQASSDHSPTGRWVVVAVGLMVLILVPLPLLGPGIDSWISQLGGAHIGPLPVAGGVIALLTIDVFVPVPSSIVATVAGHQLGFFGGAAAIWVGLTLGCLVGYAVGQRVGSRRLAAFVGEAEVARARRWLAQHRGGAGLALSRAVPMVSEATILLTGAVGAPLKRTALICALANTGVAMAYAAVGALAAHLQLAPLALVGSLLLPAIAALLTWRKDAPG